MDTLSKYEFKRTIEELKTIKGRATELISLYVPPNKQISDVTNYLKNEYAQSSNIKSTTTRKNVMWAIDSLLGKIKFFKRPLQNGMVFFIGTKSITLDHSEPVDYFIEPPEPITAFLYRCDSSFFLEPLEEMLVEHDVYGLFVIDRKEATIGLLKGKRLIPLISKQSLAPSKHGRGGQSQRRFERLIELAVHEFFVKMGDILTDTFLNEKDVKGILVGGPGATKEDFIKGSYLHHEVQKKVILPLFDVEYTNEYGLRELVEKATKTLENLEIAKEKKLIDKLLNEIKIPNGLAVYGNKVLSALQAGTVDILLISEGLKKYKFVTRCDNCEFVQEYIGKQDEVCPRCKSPMKIIEKIDMVKEYCMIAEKMGTKAEFISSDSEEGKIFLNTFDGIAGLLRFRPEGM